MQDLAASFTKGWRHARTLRMLYGPLLLTPCVLMVYTLLFASVPVTTMNCNMFSKGETRVAHGDVDKYYLVFHSLSDRLIVDL